jgi:hypothetical protein
MKKKPLPENISKPKNQFSLFVLGLVDSFRIRYFVSGKKVEAIQINTSIQKLDEKRTVLKRGHPAIRNMIFLLILFLLSFSGLNPDPDPRT